MSRWIAIELAALAATTQFACVQPPPSQGNGSSTMASRDGGASCESVCAHLVECQIEGVSAATCPQECRDGGYDQATITRFQTASCDEIRGFIANPPPQQPRPSTGGTGYHTCSAAGVYEVCADGMCRDHDADSMGEGDSVQAAQGDAVRACNHHMQTLVIAQNMNYRASVKQTCRVVGCK